MEENSSLKSAIQELEVGLLKLNKLTYDSIDKLMRRIMKTHNVTAKELHYGFRDTHNNQRPDDWIKSQRKMKTFREFLEEAKSYGFGKHFSTKDELIRHHGGSLPQGTFIKNRGTKVEPKYGLASLASREKIKDKREKNIKMTTGNLTPRERSKLEKKMSLARKRGQDLHHGTEIEYSAKEMENMSPGDRLRYKKRQARQNRYHGNDPRNLVLANRGSVSDFKPESPGFHHGKYHAFERKHRSKLRELDNAISPTRAFTTLVNKERRKSKKSKELQSRMAAAAKRLGLKD